MSKKTKFNLIRQKCDDYKAEQPEAQMIDIVSSTGEKRLVADFEIFYHNYPFACSTLMYDHESPHANQPEMPFIVTNDELWAVRGFIQVEEFLVNIHCVYCGSAKQLPMCKTTEHSPLKKA